MTKSIRSILFDFLKRTISSDALENISTKILTLLILLDFGFIFSFIFWEYGFLKSDIWNIALDRSYPEFYQYIKELWVVILLALYCARTFTFIYFSWSMLYLYILLDDYYMIHEKLGRRIAVLLDFDLSLGLRANDFGEVSVYILVGIFFIITQIFSFYRANLEARKLSYNLILLLALYTFFGFAVDMIHVILDSLIHNHMLTLYFEILEEGGEMLTMSITVWFLLRANPTPYRFNYS